MKPQIKVSSFPSCFFLFDRSIQNCKVTEDLNSKEHLDVLMSNSLSSQTQTRVLFKRGMLPVICSKLPAHIQLNIPGLCSRWMRLGEGCVTSKMSTILCFHYGHSPWNQSCFQRRNLVLRSRWTPRTMARTSFCLTNMPHPLPAWNGSDPLLEVYGMRDHSLGQNTEGPWWWDGRPYPIYIYIHIYIDISIYP